jgi:hypothetical protein
MGGERGAQRVVQRVNKPKKTGARSTRERSATKHTSILYKKELGYFVVVGRRAEHLTHAVL